MHCSSPSAIIQLIMRSILPPHVGRNIYEVKTCFNLLLEPMNCPPATATTCPRNAMDLPYGNDDIPQVCLGLIGG